MAFKELESRLAKTPYLYSMGEVLKFTNSGGVLLLGIYTPEELENWLKKKSSEGENNLLPELLVMQGQNSKENYFLLKDKMLSLCSKLLVEGRFLVKDALFKYWCKLLKEYKKEPAMESNGEFEKLLLKITKNLCPTLTGLLSNSRFLMVYNELENGPSVIPSSARVLHNGKLLPYSVLFQLQRSDVLRKVKLSLPFWYTLPILSALINFFKNHMQEKKKEPVSEAETKKETPVQNKHAAAFKTAVQEIELAIIPSNYTMDSYLEELEDRWGRLIDKKARENLKDDAKNLAIDHIRRNMKLQKNFRPTHETLNQMAYNLVTRNPALSSLSARDSLIICMEIQMIKFLKNAM
jgi:hypothetical protein